MVIQSQLPSIKIYNMKIKRHFIPFLLAGISLIISCSEENERIPIISDPTAPGVVSNIRVEPLPGAVKLTYDIPDDQNLSYIKAECLIKGILREVKASTYQNNLTIEGFADNSVHSVNLYSVSRSDVASKPVTVEVQPLNPPFQEVFKNISLAKAWGGATVTYENPTEADLAISLIYIDSTGYWNSGITSYTKRKQGSFSIRGFDPEETTFGVYLRDRWDHMTDTIVAVLTPMLEKPIDRHNFKEIRLPGDVKDAWGWVMPNLWDGIAVDPSGFHTDIDGVWPQYFTFDLGTEEGVKLSRFKFWQRNMSGVTPYNDRNIKKFELWGSMNPNPNGAFDESWKLLLTGESVKPSGLPLGQYTEEDLQALVEGDEFEFPLDVPNDVRYIRMKVTETWAKIKCFYVMEVAFWGAEPKDLNND
jgi:hypothetical protein